MRKDSLIYIEGGGRGGRATENWGGQRTGQQSVSVAVSIVNCEMREFFCRTLPGPALPEWINGAGWRNMMAKTRGTWPTGCYRKSKLIKNQIIDSKSYHVTPIVTLKKAQQGMLVVSGSPPCFSLTILITCHRQGHLCWNMLNRPLKALETAKKLEPNFMSIKNTYWEWRFPPISLSTILVVRIVHCTSKKQK